MTTDISSNKHFAVLEKVMPYLRRQGKEAKFGNKTWTWQDLTIATAIKPSVIRTAIADLCKKKNVDIVYDSQTVKFNGPPDLNMVRIYARKAKAPSTELAKAFRLHGVYLTTPLVSSTSWMRKSDRRVSSGREEIALTLQQSLIKREGRQIIYSSFELPDDSWEKRTANKSRRDALRGCEHRMQEHFRVVRVKGIKSKSGEFKIKSAIPDKNYWRLLEVSDQGRIRAVRTDQRAVIYDLSNTELGIPSLIKQI